MGSRNGPQGICFVKKQLYPLRHLALLSHISICKPSIRWLWWLIFIINLTIWNNLGKQTLEIFLWEGKSHTKCRKHHSTGWNFRLMIFFFKKKKEEASWVTVFISLCSLTSYTLWPAIPCSWDWASSTMTDYNVLSNPESTHPFLRWLMSGTFSQ